MESPRHGEGDSPEAQSDAAERSSADQNVRPAVGELTAGDLEQQRRLVRESLLLRAA